LIQITIQITTTESTIFDSSSLSRNVKLEKDIMEIVLQRKMR